MDYNVEVGKRLFNARKNKDLTRAALGKIIGLHESTVKRYEDGQIKALSVDKLKEFAAALNIEAEFLIGWEKETVPITIEDKKAHSFTVNLVLELLKEGIIVDPDHIPDDIIDLIKNALKLDVKRGTK